VGDLDIPFLDTKVLLRHLLDDHPDQSPRASAYIAAIERGDAKVRTADTVIFDTVFILDRSYRLPKAAIRAALVALLQLPGIVLPGKRGLLRAFDIYVEYNLPFGDAYHAMLMERWGLTDMLSFDREFDRLPGVRRVEP
jgi:predicted nucleic acid-binding protein